MTDLLCALQCAFDGEPWADDALAEAIGNATAAIDGPDAAEALRLAMRLDQPYSILDVLKVLAEAVDHLEDAHDCDGDGWENRRRCRDAAREIVTALEATGG